VTDSRAQQPAYVILSHASVQQHDYYPWLQLVLLQGHVLSSCVGLCRARHVILSCVSLSNDSGAAALGLLTLLVLQAAAESLVVKNVALLCCTACRVQAEFTGGSPCRHEQS
jgi:hypothetical protein